MPNFSSIVGTTTPSANKSSFSSIIGGSQPQPTSTPTPVSGFPAESIVNNPASPYQQLVHSQSPDGLAGDLARANIPVLSGIGQFLINIKNTAVGVFNQPQHQITQTFDDFRNSLSQAWQEYEKVPNYNPSASLSTNIGSGLESIVKGINVVFSPLTAAFTAANDVPVLRRATQLAALMPAVLGTAGRTLSDDVLDNIPTTFMPQHVKDNLKDGIGDIVSLAFQFGAIEKVADFSKIMPERIAELSRKYSPQDVNTIIKQAQGLAEDIKANTPEVPKRQVLEIDTSKYSDVKTASAVISPKGEGSLSIEFNPEGQGKGQGTALVKDIEQQFMDKGVDKVNIQSFPEAKGFWEKQGYSAIGEEKNGLIPMEKTLVNIKPIQEALFNLRNTPDPNDAILNPLIDQVGGILKESENNQTIKSNSNEAAQESTSERQTNKTVNSTNEQTTEAGKSRVSQSTETSPDNERSSGSLSEGSKSTSTQINGKSSDARTNRARGDGEGLKVSKIAKEIDANAVEAKLTQGFSKLAGYDPITIKEQKSLATDLINNHFEDARAIVRGEKPLPEGLKGTSVVTAMEEALKKNPDGQLASELARSPLVSGTSTAAQELRLAAERDPYSAVNVIKKLEDDRRAIIEKQKNISIKETTKKELKSLDKELEKTKPSKSEWASFIKEIQC